MPSCGPLKRRFSIIWSSRIGLRVTELRSMHEDACLHPLKVIKRSAPAIMAGQSDVGKTSTAVNHQAAIQPADAQWSTQDQDTPPCSLLRLPPELRNRIYSLLASEATALFIEKARYPPLNSTCRQLRREFCSFWVQAERINHGRRQRIDDPGELTHLFSDWRAHRWDVKWDIGFVPPGSSEGAQEWFKTGTRHQKAESDASATLEDSDWRAVFPKDIQSCRWLLQDRFRALEYVLLLIFSSKAASNYQAVFARRLDDAGF